MLKFRLNSFVDYLFGIVYDPGHSRGDHSGKWVIILGFPKDFILQHAVSLKRFDEKLLLFNGLVGTYYLEAELSILLKKHGRAVLRLNSCAARIPTYQ